MLILEKFSLIEIRNGWRDPTKSPGAPFTDMVYVQSQHGLSMVLPLKFVALNVVISIISVDVTLLQQVCGNAPINSASSNWSQVTATHITGIYRHIVEWSNFLERMLPGISRFLNTSRPWQNCRHFAEGIFKCIFLYEKAWFSLKISLNLVP